MSQTADFPNIPPKNILYILLSMIASKHKLLTGQFGKNIETKIERVHFFAIYFIPL